MKTLLNKKQKNNAIFFVYVSEHSAIFGTYYFGSFLKKEMEGGWGVQILMFDRAKRYRYGDAKKKWFDRLETQNKQK